MLNKPRINSKPLNEPGKEAERQLDVLAGRAHHDRKRLAVEHQLQRLLGDDRVGRLAPPARVPLANAQAGCCWPGHPSATRSWRADRGTAVVIANPRHEVTRSAFSSMTGGTSPSLMP